MPNIIWRMIHTMHFSGSMGNQEWKQENLEQRTQGRIKAGLQKVEEKLQTQPTLGAWTSESQTWS